MSDMSLIPRDSESAEDVLERVIAAAKDDPRFVEVPDRPTEEEFASLPVLDLDEFQRDGEPTDDEIYNGYGREGGIAYDPTDEPGSLGENDWRL